jgi:hypothetical protein
MIARNERNSGMMHWRNTGFEPTVLIFLPKVRSCTYFLEKRIVTKVNSPVATQRTKSACVPRAGDKNAWFRARRSLYFSCGVNPLTLKEVVGASGFEPPTPWSRTGGSENLKSCRRRAYELKPLRNPLSVVTHFPRGFTEATKQIRRVQLGIS